MQFKQYRQIWTKIIAEGVRCAERVVQQQQQVCATLSAIIFSFYSVSHYIYLCLKKSLNDEERGRNCLLVPERSYGPGDNWFEVIQLAVGANFHT